MKKKLISLNILFSILKQVVLIEWNYDSPNKLYWAFDCDFDGNDMTNVRMNGETCGPTCSRTTGCTHFAWSKYQGGTCWMKKGSISKTNAKTIQGSDLVCGIIDAGVLIEWNFDSPNKLYWAFDCDFEGNDLTNTQTNGESCGPTCLRTNGCTHFTWSDYQGGTCWMKKGSISKTNAKIIQGRGFVCGIMNSDGSSNFPGSKFKQGLIFDSAYNSNDYSKYDYITIWINSPWGDNPSKTDFNPYWHGEMIKTAKQLNKMPVFYAYIIAFQGRAMYGYKDCDVDPVNNLCRKGANFIRNNRQLLVSRYAHQSSEIAKALGNRNAECIFLIEPDFWQYYGDTATQEGGTLSGEYMRSLFDDFAKAIRNELPNAKISWDLSAWIGEQGLINWWGYFRTSPFIDFVHTSGGQGKAGSTEYKPNELKWSDLSRITGKKIIADCGYGVGGGTSSNCQEWNRRNKQNRISDGVVALSAAQGAKYNPPDLERIPL